MHVSFNHATKVAAYQGCQVNTEHRIWRSSFSYPNNSTVIDYVGCFLLAWYKHVGMAALNRKDICGMLPVRIASTFTLVLYFHTEFLSVTYVRTSMGREFRKETEIPFAWPSCGVAPSGGNVGILCPYLLSSSDIAVAWTFARLEWWRSVRGKLQTSRSS